MLSLATSAADDAGAEPLRELASSLSTRGISVVGFGSSAVDAVSPALFTTAGVLVAIHAISIIDDDGPSAIAAVDAPGIAGPDSADLLLESVVESLLAGADVIVLVNWGDADARAPTAEQLEFMDRLIETGATAIVGNGPRLERYELVESVPVAHSLGPASTDETDPLLVDAAIARLVLPDASASCLVPATASIAGPIPDRSLTDGCDRPE